MVAPAPPQDLVPQQLLFGAPAPAGAAAEFALIAQPSSAPVIASGAMGHVEADGGAATAMQMHTPLLLAKGAQGFEFDSESDDEVEIGELGFTPLALSSAAPHSPIGSIIAVR